MVKKRFDAIDIIIGILLLVIAYILVSGGIGSTQCSPGEEMCGGINDQQYLRCGTDKTWDNLGFVEGKCGWTDIHCIQSGYSCAVDSDCCSYKCSYFQCE